MVESTFCLAGYIARCYTLFYSSIFGSKLNKELESLKFQVVASTPVGVELVSNEYYEGCEIIIGEMKTHAKEDM